MPPDGSAVAPLPPVPDPAAPPRTAPASPVAPDYAALGGAHAGVPAGRSLVVAGQPFVTESGVMVLLPPGPDGTPRQARVPVASYMSERAPRIGFAAVFAAMPAFMRYFLIAFSVVSVCLGFAYLGSTVVASRYAFSEVEVAPGRSTFYRVDRWTGTMVQCATMVGPSDGVPVC